MFLPFHRRFEPAGRGLVMAILWGFSRFAMSRSFQSFSIAGARLGMV
jgi:hypothetical protein